MLYALFIFDHALKFTGKTLLLDGNAFLYIVRGKIFGGSLLNLFVKTKVRMPDGPWV